MAEITECVHCGKFIRRYTFGPWEAYWTGARDCEGSKEGHVSTEEYKLTKGRKSA